MKTLKQYLGISVFFILILTWQLKESSANILILNSMNNNTSGVFEITMEGETYRLSHLNIEQSKFEIDENKIKFTWFDSEFPIQINITLTEDAVVKGKKTSVTYSLPDANQTAILVDLNFFNKTRESSRINKRILFRKGVIVIEEVTKNNLKMQFDGEGSGLRENNMSFPIKGFLNVSF
jgi:hypothetical protein